MTLFRLRFKELGGHTHVRVFAGKSVAGLGKCGDLTFRNDEWKDFLDELAYGYPRELGQRLGSIEVLEEES